MADETKTNSVEPLTEANATGAVQLNDDKTPVTAPLEADQEAQPETFVQWDALNHFEERRLRWQDFVSLGATPLTVGTAEPADVVWNEANRHRVARKDVPLTDDQLDALMTRDPKFRIVGAV